MDSKPHPPTEPIERLEPLLATAFLVAPDPMIVVDPVAGQVLSANGPARNLLGWPDGIPPGQTVIDLHPGQIPALIVFTDAALTTGRTTTRALVPLRTDARELRLEYVGARLPRAGAPPLLVIAMHDLDARERANVDADADTYLRGGIEEWRRVQKVFREMERENQLLLRAAGEGIYGVDAKGCTSFLNPAGERMLGWSAEDLVGKDMHAMIHHTHRDGHHYHRETCPIYAAFNDGEIHRVEDEVFWRKDGQPLRVEYTSTPIRDHGRLIGAVIVFRDISRRKEAEEQLHTALTEVSRLRERLEMENDYLREEIRVERNHHEIIGKSAPIQGLLDRIALVGVTDASVLITGESGTGKELIARAIHEASTRNQRPLIRVNCAAIPRELFESEFFGHVRGAFTGATRDRVGRFELANGGTLFLDEVGEIPLELQAKLLRVIQERVLERVGQETTRKVDVRIIAATNKHLQREVDAGRFREDLFFRLNVFPIESVALRQRREDIPLLAVHFLDRACRKLNLSPLTLTQGDAQTLRAYDWPGNVRELENVIERAAILARDGRLRIELPKPQAEARNEAPIEGREEGRILTVQDMRELEKRNIALALEQTRGRVSGPGGAADRLGMKPTTLSSRIKALGLRENAPSPMTTWPPRVDVH
ncbi:MAG: sigma 54-interacting transcriptional regulator [Rhodospirillum sp.]|nr:sigma 54-interacting transcriptional regulator [Rhodospirillum sp.]MCF8490420.1 sigma 54-interacting transcriptional regulator [Rhodospirillum sp.]MCF8500983.1 sigma 54-interacting transcriptional regulator [Rhodospirillum sp.]